MIKLEAVQQHAVDLIKANAYFAGEAVILDCGNSESERERALTGIGRCVMVHPIIGFDKKQDGAGKVVGDATVYISIESNPKKNTGESAKPILLMVSYVIASLIGFAPVNPNDNYKLVDAPLESYDEGLLAYGPTFSKQCVI